MLGALLETLLLFINAIAILNEKRFLKKCTVWYRVDGFSTVSGMENNPNENLTSKSQIIMLMYTLRSFGRCKYGDR